MRPAARLADSRCGFTPLPRVCRQALLGGSESLARGTARLDQGQRVLLETENLGNDVLVSLQRQRQQIKGAQCAHCARALARAARVAR